MKGSFEMELNKKYKSMNGITLVALVVTIVVLLILAGISINALSGENGILGKASEAKTKTEIADIKEQIQTDIIGEQAGNTGNISKSALETILQKYGEINYDTDGTTIKSITTTKGNYEITMADIYTGTAEVVIGDGSWDNGNHVYSPKIEGTGLTAVYWSGTQWVKLTSSSSQEEWKKWYSYTTEKKEWANAQSADGSMWVWIPRYEYKITDKTITVNFVKIGTQTTADYTLHPAFINDSANGYSNGGWSTDLTGFWVAKYPAGYQNSTVGEETKTVKNSDLTYTELNGYTSNFLNETLTTSTNISYPVFKANTYAYNIISVGDAFLLSQKIKDADMYGLSNVDSHLEKNSEWGAVAYLTQSQYGVNGNSTNMNEVTMNTKDLSNSIYVNNASSGTKANIYAVTSYGISNTANDVTASSTKNMTGVFDLNGCVWERVAGYYKGGAASAPNWHNSMASSSTTESSKYLTLYTTNNKKGDATNETAGWNSDYSDFVSSGYPVFGRGGHYGNGTSAGVFAYYNSLGNPSSSSGFRVCLAF